MNVDGFLGIAATSFMECVLSIWLKLSLEILEPGGEIRFLNILP